MHFGSVGWLEIVIVLVVVLLIFGPKNLPKLGKAIGRTVKNLRDGMDSGKRDEEIEAGEAKKVDDAVVEAVDDQSAEKPSSKSE